MSEDREQTGAFSVIALCKTKHLQATDIPNRKRPLASCFSCPTAAQQIPNGAGSKQKQEKEGMEKDPFVLGERDNSDSR
ncbi:hypothetical protein TNCV_3158951 [Trichonephila clavipes]|nr:hypothetical protein TNCV_3158951 [Trichonephila clavipes]